MRVVHDAIELTNRTGRDALEMSPRQISLAMRSLMGSDRKQRLDIATAVAAGFGSEKSFELLKRL